MKIQEGKVVLIQLDTRTSLDGLLHAGDCYTRADSYDDLIIDVDIMDGSDELQKAFKEATGLEFSTVSEYQYIVCWS